MTSDKQRSANRKNAFKWWVKSQKWRDIVRFNALSHWLSSNVYDEELEKSLIAEYGIIWTLEKMLVKNTCIAKSRYERGVELENLLMQSILFPPKLEKIYSSQDEYDTYIQENEQRLSFINTSLIWPKEPSYTLKKIEGNTFDYDLERIQHLTGFIWKYNYLNEVRLTKNIELLLSINK